MAIVTSIDIIDEGKDWAIAIPLKGLASPSITLERKGENNFDELFKLMQKVARFWEQHGVNHYLAYTSSQDTHWEMVPYQGSSASLWDKISAFFRQVLVLGRVIWGKATIPAQERKRLYEEYKDIASVKVQETAAKVQQTAQDAFCNSKVIDSQLIWEGKYIRVLYNYAPLGPAKIHFLLVPKEHKERFTQLSLEEFQEIQLFATTLMQHYPDHTCFRYHKTGVLAGQTVPHFHEHLVFVLPQHELKGKLSVFYRMIMPPKPLSSTQLAGRVAALKKEFHSE